MKITLLDPGLRGIRGHHFDLDLRLARALARRGHTVEIHAYHQADPALLEQAREAGLALHRTFRIPTYTRLRWYQPRHRAYAKLIATTAEDLAQVAPSDLWFWPTLAPYQLAAALSQRDAVRQLGGSWWLPQKPVPAGTAAWAGAVHTLSSCDYPIQVGAYASSLCDAHTRLWPALHMHALPCPHDGALKKRHTDRVQRIGFLGHQRNKRGIQLLPTLVTALLAQGFDVIVQDSGDSDLVLPSHPRLTRLPYIEHFADAIADCDLVVWPSQPEAYQHCWSGVISESIASGVPVVAAANCLPGNLVADYGCGTLFDTATPQCILAAIAQAVQAYPQLLDNAQDAAADWQAHHGTERLAAWLENHAMTAATHSQGQALT